MELHDWLAERGTLITDEDMDKPGSVEHTGVPVLNRHPHVEPWLHTIKQVVDSGKYNYQSCRILVNDKWNFQLLSNLLIDYKDSSILQYLQFGWPIDRDMEVPLEMGGRNHKGATDFQEQVDQYITKELGLGAMIGPFEALPFKGPVAISPLSTRAKKGSEARRIIMDCSWPIGSSLNDGIAKDRYLGKKVDLRYPTVDKLAARVHKLYEADMAKPIYFFKEDMDRAFR